MLLVGLVQIGAYFWAASDARPDPGLALTQPDTFFYCQAARRICEGHPFSFSEGTAPSTGTTSVIHPFLLAVPYALGAKGDRLLYAFFALDAVCYLIFLWGWSVVIRRRIEGAFAQTVAALLIAFMGQIAYVCFDQSDQGLLLAFSALFAAALAADSPGGILACLLVGPWVRPEGMFFVIAYALFGARRRYALWGALSAAGVFALNYALTGDAQFSSVVQKGYFKCLPFGDAVTKSLADVWDSLRVFFLGLAWNEKSASRGWYFPPLLCATLMWIGVFTRRWRKDGLRNELVWICACAGGWASVVTSGWIATNYDRYVSWTLPTILLFATEGGEYVASRVRVRRLNRVPTLLLVLFVAVTSLVTLAFYHVCAKGVDYDRRFMIKCDKAMEKGASVGAVCECSAAYLYSPRRVACVGGVYSPELQTPLGTSPFDILKNRSETRFDYWYNEGALWGMMSSNEVERLGVRLADDGRLRALMRADWTPFDAALEPPRYDGWSLTDTVDVGYAPDERRVGFEVLGRKRRHVHPYFHLFNDESTGRVIADSGVCAKEGVALTVDPPSGSEWMIAVRIVDEECEQRLEGFRVRYEGAADPSCFRTVVVNADRPVTAAGPTRLFLRGEFSPAVVWIYSRASRPVGSTHQK